MAKLIDVYDTRTGNKLPDPGPEHCLDLFDYLSTTPKAKSSESKTTQKKEG